MPLDPVAFAKCTPSLGTDIKRCGSVTICNNKPATADELSSIFKKGTNYRVLEAILHFDIEIKQCEAVQNGLYDFFFANKVPMDKNIQTRRKNSGLLEIAPFVLAKQRSPINNAYWYFTNGTASGGNWSVRVYSSTNIPNDVRSFPVGMRLYADGKSVGGSTIHTSYVVVSATLAADSSYITVVMTPKNSASNIAADKLGNATSGMLRRGTPNVNDFENFCAENPAYLNWKYIPFWVETTRNTMCDSDQYRKWRKLAMENAYYREFGDLDDIERNRQIAQDWQRRLVDTAFWGKPLEGQNQNDFDALDDISAYSSTVDGTGVDGGTCVGKRANLVGIYEQLAQCGRVEDLQNGQLNLPALFVAFYNIMRVREGNGHPKPTSIDVFTDSVFAELINQAMIKYYNSKSDNTMRLTKSVDRQIKTAEFGFNYESYRLFWPNVTMNVITHNYFDDYVAAAASSPAAIVGTSLWVLDFTGIYPGIFASNRKQYTSGEVDQLAKIIPNFACVMATNTQRQTLNSLTWTVVVECPMGNLILEGIAATVPEHATLTGRYPSSTTSTTSTTFAPFTG